jgi:hypothetical protein
MRQSTRGKGGNQPRSVSLEIMFWKTPSGTIHVATNDQEARDFHVAITADPNKRNGHPTLYRRLDSYLKRKLGPVPESA